MKHVALYAKKKDGDTVEAKAKVVASFWGQNLFNSLVVLQEKVEFILFFQIDRGKTAIARQGIE